MTRGEFLKTAGSAAILAAAGDLFGSETAIGAKVDFAALQREIDEVSPQDLTPYFAGDDSEGSPARKPALLRLDAAFDKVLNEVKATAVSDRPAVWLVYNMGVIVKTKEACFSIDLMHRKATEAAPLLDFALITHSHGDHFTEAFYRAMNDAGKTVISNFKDNYGTKNGGYTRATKTFKLKDVAIRTSLTDHNNYLVDFTTAFEIRAGEFTIYHTGDCSSLAKLNPTRRPDLWIVHPYCGMNVADGIRKLTPTLTAMAHLNELGHARNRWRWSWSDGLKAKARAEEVGGQAIVPVWGERIF